MDQTNLELISRSPVSKPFLKYGTDQHAGEKRSEWVEQELSENSVFFRFSLVHPALTYKMFYKKTCSRQQHRPRGSTTIARSN